MTYDVWLAHFRANPARHDAIEAAVDWDSRPTVTGATRRAYIHSFQRFELGENGDGARLLTKAERAGDPTYLSALTLLVEEEQKHSALFRRGLQHLGASTLESHWSDTVFERLRRALGLRTELALFLIAETVAMPYFIALADGAPDPVLRAIGTRIVGDERDHVRFQIDRLHHGFLRTPTFVRVIIGATWLVIAAGAATVVAVDHRAALRACGLSPMKYWGDAVGELRRAARSVLGSPRPSLGPLPDHLS